MAFPEAGRRRALIGSAALAVAVIAIGWIAMSSSSDDDDVPDAGDATATTVAAVAPSTSSSVIVSDELIVDDTGFAADVLVAQVGVPFVILNEDDEPHAWSSDDGFVSSGIIEPGRSFRHVYAEPGTRTYHCEVHPDEVVTVEVVEAS